MPEIPDFWPPPQTGLRAAADASESRAKQGDSAGDCEGVGTTVPLFPLADVWLFPGAVLPLNIFEPRYRQMIDDSLDGPGRLVIGTVARGHEEEMPGAPPVYPIAGLGEIGRHERRPDGRFVILLVGLGRVHLEEVESDRLYRQVRVAPVQEIEAAAEEELELREALRAAIAERAVGQDLPDEFPLPNLIDILLLRMPLPHAAHNGIYSELDLGRRARAALAEHANRPHRAE